VISLTLLTQDDCVWCADGRQLLSELAHEFLLDIKEVDLASEFGHRLAAEHHLMFAPGLIADGHLIAHGRLSKRALRRELTRLSTR